MQPIAFMDNNAQRNSNIELLRLILMLFIVIHHGIVYGAGLIELKTNVVDNILPIDLYSYGIVNSFLVFSVNSFLLISGFLGIKPNRQKIISLIITVLFYHILFSILYNILIGASMKTILLSLFVFSCTPYWFVFFYIFLCYFAPMLNDFFKDVPQKKQNKFILMLLVGSCYFGFVWNNKINLDGYTLFQFFMVYSIGRYLSLHTINLSKVKCISIYLLSVLIVVVIYCSLIKYGLYRYAWKIFFYNNPLVLLSSVVIFLLFRKVHFQSKAVNNISKSALAIYLFQNSRFCETVYYNYIKEYYSQVGGLTTIILIIMLSVIISILSILIDRIQLIINKRLLFLISK